MNNEHLNALHQYNTPEISDALDACGINGYLKEIDPIGNARKLIGPAYTVKYQPYEQTPDEFMQASHYIEDVPAGYVVVIDNNGIETCSVWGGILTHFAHFNKIAGTVIYGMMRDKAVLEKYHYPVYARGVTPRTGKNRVKLIDKKCLLTCSDVKIEFNDIIFADSNGVLVIPKNQIEMILKMAKNIKKSENMIIKAIDAGSSLKEARETYHYDRPWEQD